MGAEKILSRLVQVGHVSAADAGKQKVRVKFSETGITSGWLYVLQHGGMGVTLTPDGEHTHNATVTDANTGGNSATIEAVPNHDHQGSKTTAWMPKVNDRVVVLYLPVDDGDGFVLGGI